MPNHLINETSPYLLQHAHNPVNWYPWGEAALNRAKAENKPIFLSIGYAACHWCHVMERESFENEQIAAVMNEHFINIKVDREERPDLDAIYMDAVTALTGQGGWPMSVWLTPAGVPFYGGTYFPPTDRMGMPGFPRLLTALAQAYHDQKEAIKTQSRQIMQRMVSGALPLSAGPALDPRLPRRAAAAILQQIDTTHGGTGRAPKFPQPMVYDFLLRAFNQTGQQSLLNGVELTLQHMARGGIYDHLGGGFHRYATDAVWLVPHFEKMLYDNALLARLYLHAWQLTRKPLYKQVVEETLNYVIREMTGPRGGFYATQDADSEGEEGKFFVWTPAEITQVLGAEAGRRFCAAYDVTGAGNREGKSILRRTDSLPAVARQFNMAEESLTADLARSRATLFAHRERRVKPARDEKTLTGWNGLMLAAFAEAARVLGRDDYLAVAEKNAGFLLTHLQREGRLLRTWKSGRAKLMAYLEDYAFLADGLLALYQTTFDDRWFVAAKNLMDVVLSHFADEKEGGFFDTATDHETLVVRPKSLQDNAIPSGNAMATRNLLLLAAYTGNEAYHRTAVKALRGIQNTANRFPLAFAHWLGALVLAVSPLPEVAVIGPKDHPQTQALLAVAQKAYRPQVVTALSPAETDSSPVSLLNHRPPVKGKPTAYVCQNSTCRLPVTTPKALQEELARQ